MKANYKYANHIFEIETEYDYFHDFSKEYLTDEIAECLIKIDDQDLQNEILKSDAEYPFEYLETLAVYRKVCSYLIDYNILLIHGSCIVIDDYAYLFIAKSGVGKSTHTRLIKKLLKDRVEYLNDDKPLIEINEDSIIAYGNPWNGKHNLSNNIAYPLKGIICLNRGDINKIEKISFNKAYIPLYKQVHKVDKAKALALIDKLAKLDYYNLECNILDEAAEVSVKGLGI